MVFIEKSKQSLTIDQIEGVEQRLKLKLPYEYKEFLMKYNGGIPSSNIVTYYDHLGRSTRSVVDYFLAIYDEYGYDNLVIKYEYFISSNRIPLGILPIASDPFGNLICISTREKDNGKIYFLDHELDQSDYGNLGVISNNFSEFLRSLK